MNSKCPHCNGAGLVVLDGQEVYMECSYCNGTGIAQGD